MQNGGQEEGWKKVERRQEEGRKKEDRFKVRRRNVQSTPKEHPWYREAICKVYDGYMKGI